MTTSDPQSGASSWQPEPQPQPQPYASSQPLPARPEPAPFSHPAAPPYQGEYAAQYPWTSTTYAGAWTPPPAAPPKPSRTKRSLLGVGAAVLAAALVVSGVEIGHAMSPTGGTGTVAQAPAFGGTGTGSGTSGGTSGGTTGGGTTGGGTTGQFPGLFPGGGTGSGSGSGTTAGTAATSTQTKGVVTIVSVLSYENAESAGTGMVVTSDGEVLTNNHVVEGATSVTVTDESTGTSYKASVVGTDPTDDVAVLQLKNASGLTTAQLGDASDVSALKVGAKVTGVGNAGGTGSLTQASGTVTALGQSITASDETGSNAENLTGLIETDAGIVSGDSGGPLYDADGTIIGIDTAASSSNGTGTAASQAYAIPIDHALTIAQQIESGVETSSVHIGLPAFIGVGVADTGTAGAGVSSVVDGGPAADAGITAGSTITKVGGKAVTSAAQLKQRLSALDPGDKVSISWTDASGAGHTATVTLASGPAD